MQPRGRGRQRFLKLNAGRIDPRVPEGCEAARRPRKITFGQRSLTPQKDPVEPQRLGRLTLVRSSQEGNRTIRRRYVHAFTGVNRAVVCAQHMAERVAGGVVEGHRQKLGWCSREQLGDSFIIGGRSVRLEPFPVQIARNGCCCYSQHHDKYC